MRDVVGKCCCEVSSRELVMVGVIEMVHDVIDKDSETSVQDSRLSCDV